MEKQLLRLCLTKAFWSINRDRVVREMFGGDTATLFDTLVTAHKNYPHDISLTELKELHRVDHPTMTRVARQNVEELIASLEFMKPISEDVATTVLHHMWRVETFRQLADLSLAGMEGKTLDLEDIRRLVDSRGESFLPADDVDFITNDLDELLELNDSAHSYKFNIPSLAEKLPGMSGGEFLIGFSRPETGKTAFYISLACAPGGWAWQGAKVLILCNEEPGRRTLMRAVTAACGKDKAWVNDNRKEARAIWDKIKDNVILGDAVGMTLGRLDNLARKHKPDIMIVDQLDKVSVSGSFAATHEKLRAIYTQAREIAKRYNLLMVAISQASAEAEGKMSLSYNLMEGSKTGKAAEADVIIGIGKYPQGEDTDEDFTRGLSLSKNKCSSWHGTVYAKLLTEVSTYTS